MVPCDNDSMNSLDQSTVIFLHHSGQYYNPSIQFWLPSSPIQKQGKLHEFLSWIQQNLHSILQIKIVIFSSNNKLQNTEYIEQ